MLSMRFVSTIFQRRRRRLGWGGIIIIFLFCWRERNKFNNRNTRNSRYNHLSEIILFETDERALFGKMTGFGAIDAVYDCDRSPLKCKVQNQLILSLFVWNIVDDRIQKHMRRYRSRCWNTRKLWPNRKWVPFILGRRCIGSFLFHFAH